jgi:fatty acid desaturase
VLASFAFNFSVHISFHESVHMGESRKIPVWMPYLMTVFLGLPLDGYRIHHNNHHQYNNGRGDYSSTWAWTAEGRRPYGLWSYVFLWPLMLHKARLDIAERVRKGMISAKVAHRVASQKLALIVMLALLFVTNPIYVGLYFVMVYLGWALVSLHNYGQHPPISDLDGHGVTVAGRVYNYLLANNGLHWEHHKAPSLAWHELQNDPRSPKIRSSHLIEPF